MNILFRADASTQIGTGHIMRCLTMAAEMRQEQAEVFFICRELQGHLCGCLERENIPVFRLGCPELIEAKKHYSDQHSIGWEDDAEEVIQILKKEFFKRNLEIDWLIVDHYDLDKQWEKKMRPFVKKIMVIDDLADRFHDCDLILDQNLCVNMEQRYDGLVPEGCIKLLGPKYALLRPEFKEAREKLRKRNGPVKRILVFLGGSDPSNETVKVLKAIEMLGRCDIAVDVIAGISNPQKEQVKEFCNSMPNTYYYCQVDNMAEFMAQADLAVGAGGSTAWERCCLGLPTLTIITAKNQEETTRALALTGATLNLGYCHEITSAEISQVLNLLISNEFLLNNMQNAALSVIPGIGPGYKAIIKSGTG